MVVSWYHKFAILKLVLDLALAGIKYRYGHYREENSNNILRVNVRKHVDLW